MHYVYFTSVEPSQKIRISQDRNKQGIFNYGSPENLNRITRSSSIDSWTYKSNAHEIYYKNEKRAVVTLSMRDGAFHKVEYPPFNTELFHLCIISKDHDTSEFNSKPPIYWVRYLEGDDKFIELFKNESIMRLPVNKIEFNTFEFYPSFNHNEPDTIQFPTPIFVFFDRKTDIPILAFSRLFPNWNMEDHERRVCATSSRKVRKMRLK